MRQEVDSVPISDEVTATLIASRRDWIFPLRQTHKALPLWRIRVDCYALLHCNSPPKEAYWMHEGLIELSSALGTLLLLLLLPLLHHHLKPVEDQSDAVLHHARDVMIQRISQLKPSFLQVRISSSPHLKPYGRHRLRGHSLGTHLSLNFFLH